MTGFEINKRLAVLVILDKLGSKVASIEYDDRQNVLWVETVGFSAYEIPDYCNDCSAMGPVIFDLGISIVYDDVFNTYCSFSSDWEIIDITRKGKDALDLCRASGEYTDKNPLRAAALVAIKVLEARNE